LRVDGAFRGAGQHRSGGEGFRGDGQWIKSALLRVRGSQWLDGVTKPRVPGAL
jgi:hypothetical protein